MSRSTQSRWMPKGGYNPTGELTVSLWREKPMLEQFAGRTCDPMGYRQHVMNWEQPPIPCNTEGGEVGKSRNKVKMDKKWRRRGRCFKDYFSLSYFDLIDNKLISLNGDYFTHDSNCQEISPCSSFKPFISFSLPCSAEEESYRVAFVSTWNPSKVNPPQ